MQLNKHIKYMIIAAIVMLLSLILLLNTMMDDNHQFRLANSASFIGLFLCGLFYLISHWNSYRKEKKGSESNV